MESIFEIDVQLRSGLMIPSDEELIFLNKKSANKGVCAFIVCGYPNQVLV